MQEQKYFGEVEKSEVKEEKGKDSIVCLKIFNKKSETKITKIKREKR